MKSHVSHKSPQNNVQPIIGFVKVFTQTNTHTHHTATQFSLGCFFLGCCFPSTVRHNDQTVLKTSQKCRYFTIVLPSNRGPRLPVLTTSTSVQELRGRYKVLVAGFFYNNNPHNYLLTITSR